MEGRCFIIQGSEEEAYETREHIKCGCKSLGGGGVVGGVETSEKGGKRRAQIN